MNDSAARPDRAERRRLAECEQSQRSWKWWGPYLSERQWGTVREDYSAGGTAWDYFPHDHARSRAYRWGEDGLFGLSDDRQLLCLSFALWNERDPILKERLFGLTNGEGNHGEDVKELYYYLDATPSHAYLKMLYKYPQAAYPYSALAEENRRRGSAESEFELIDTGVMSDGRYFDVFVEYAQLKPGDIFARVTIFNRGPEAAVLHVLPQLVYRNTWSWKPNQEKPTLALQDGHVVADHPEIGVYHVFADDAPDWLFTENETNTQRLYGIGAASHCKDAFHAFVVNRDLDSVNALKRGTKCAAHYRVTLAAGASTQIRLRLAPDNPLQPFADCDALFEQRLSEANAFYAGVQRELEDPDARLVQRQAFAGLIWSKQFFNLDMPEWLKGDPLQVPPPPERRCGRNRDWEHLNNADIISMPDKWEYPWYAAWDLAFHTLPFALIDPSFAKTQLLLLTREWYMHPNGQMPAYEWAFGDVNPPVHAWATWRVFQMDRKARGDAGDLLFLERVFHKLMLNFTWWVNRKDAQGRNVFQGGFLGLDNIGVFDRSAPLPTGGRIDQADGTSWMAMYALNLMRIALELGQHNHAYEDIATKFFEHFLQIVGAMNNLGGAGIGLWDDEDEFFYDVLHLPDDTKIPLKVRSMVGLIPLFAVETLEPELLDRVPAFKARLEWFLAYRPDLSALVSNWTEEGKGRRRLLSLLRGHRMKRLLHRMLDETEFLSPHGVRALSKHHQAHPYVLKAHGMDFSVSYLPAESNTGLFGGNSNWRGPVWFPVNYLLIESLQKFHHYYGDEFRVECPTGSGKFVSLNEAAEEIARRLSRIFLKDEKGKRPVFSQYPMIQENVHFRDYLLFHEYFDGDVGRGVGASHQTGWTALIAKILQPREPPKSPSKTPLDQSIQLPAH